jgi:hypothetical protein
VLVILLLTWFLNPYPGSRTFELVSVGIRKLQFCFKTRRTINKTKRIITAELSVKSTIKTGEPS